MNPTTPYCLFPAQPSERRAALAFALTAAALLSACASGPEASPGTAADPAGVPVVTIEPKSVATAPASPAVEPAAPTPAAPAPVTSGSVAPASPLPPAPAATSTTAPPTPAAMAPKAAAPMALVKGFYVNVGLFAVASNANNAYQKLDKAGLPVFSEGVQSAKGPVTRVRVGPFSTRAKADTAAQKIKALKLDAQVFKH